MITARTRAAGYTLAMLKEALDSLGINADPRSVFNWNVKQLFVYITAEYETELNVLNQVVVAQLAREVVESLRAARKALEPASVARSALEKSRGPRCTTPGGCF